MTSGQSQTKSLCIKMRKHLLNTLGFICVGIGIVALFVPLVPTVPFLIVAAWCFSQGSEKIHRWLIRHRYFGPAIQDWQRNRAIPPRAKALACIMLSCSMAFALWYHEFSVPVKCVVVVIGISAIVYILTRNSGGRNEN
jgi:uncharacterized membrane protein YbaN (DUF454 family)